MVTTGAMAFAFIALISLLNISQFQNLYHQIGKNVFSKGVYFKIVLQFSDFLNNFRAFINL